jgi:hypothetical protein
MNDDTKFLIVHPFYSFDSDNYGRYYTYYSLDEKFNLDNNIEIWVIDSGTFCIAKCWSEFKKSFLELPNVLNVDTTLKIDNTDFLIRRIPMNEFTPNSLGDKSDILDYICSKNNAVPAKDEGNIKGYVKIGNEAFAIINVTWHYDDSASDEDEKYAYCQYDNLVLEKKYKKYEEGYTMPIAISNNLL